MDRNTLVAEMENKFATFLCCFLLISIVETSASPTCTTPQGNEIAPSASPSEGSLSANISGNASTTNMPPFDGGKNGGIN
ncbi:hypothetical protein L1987_54938 [Smallanthus sonchifolius]|uniref:Uncharacterized protein n=1 Tax=Smallanthus sonchifolius TaxID=185202 RepID=A0ACB9E969_9ASTR|nr:hypothetical protein L1987_54938 [Smallanthus sonchifolius]